MLCGGGGYGDARLWVVFGSCGGGGTWFAELTEQQPKKRKVYNQSILPVLARGSETWHLLKELEKKAKNCIKRNGEKNIWCYTEK